EGYLMDPEPSSTLRAAGSENLVVAAVGLGTQPGLLEFTVPVASSTDILSARLRWVGRGANPVGDSTVLVNGHQRAGTLLATLNVGGSLPWVFFYEYDATTVARPGSNRWFVSGFNLGSGSRHDGIGVLVRYRDPSSPWTSILTVDPREFVSAGRGSVWEFPTGTSRDPRNARFVMLAGDCTSSSTDRLWWSAAAGPTPSELVGVAPHVMENRLSSSVGSWMDLLAENLVIPARASHFAYQLESPNDGAGDTIVHFFGALLSDGEGSFCTGSISGRVWQDDDGDGVDDGTEPGLGGVSVELRDAIGPVETASTDETGAFSFPSLCAGEYVVTVDETMLPSGLRPTTCSGGDCSPLTVALATDESAVSGIAFGWATPLVPTAGCFSGLGFWKHEYGVMTGVKDGRQHVEPEVLAGFLRQVDEATALDWTRGDGSLDPSDAFAVLVENGSTPCENAARHYFVALLNFALNGAQPSLDVDTDADGARDMTFGAAIETVEALFAEGGDDACRAAKRIATSINAMPSGECSF
ncbi:MAG: SdrD B-like domain-containing protein, partial [bacterium]